MRRHQNEKSCYNLLASRTGPRLARSHTSCLRRLLLIQHQEAFQQSSYRLSVNVDRIAAGIPLLTSTSTADNVSYPGDVAGVVPGAELGDQHTSS